MSLTPNLNNFFARFTALGSRLAAAVLQNGKDVYVNRLGRLGGWIDLLRDDGIERRLIGEKVHLTEI